MGGNSTRENLGSRGVILDSSLCPMCLEVPKTVEHVFARCKEIDGIWCLIARWWDVVAPYSYLFEVGSEIRAGDMGCRRCNQIVEDKGLRRRKKSQMFLDGKNQRSPPPLLTLPSLPRRHHPIAANNSNSSEGTVMFTSSNDFLHFADDAIFLGQWNDNNLRKLLRILTYFHLASGLKINWSKSTLSGIGTTKVEILRMAGVIGCKVGNIPFRYPGLLIGANMHKKESWRLVLEKFDQKLLDWKAKTLSMGGRLCLCKAVLGAIGVYLFSIYKAPNGIIKELEKKRRQFFWGSTNNHSKMAWVAWEVVLNSTENGGLGLGSLHSTNIALLTKWWWRFKNEKEALWRRVIVALYGETAKLGCDSTSFTRKSTWSYIARINSNLEVHNLHLQDLFQRHLRNGSDIKFWQENWCRRGTLAESVGFFCDPRIKLIRRTPIMRKRFWIKTRKPRSFVLIYLNI
ncbi:hypothetical protein OSB04_011403 [Centaurea solstitialis]|uniref:Uncharacterized protein n=1 Tax=Centaurea solstitialis TaxID=347529 RepID=A0AA38WP32_9ASTR|nr:hypothetical protein OSB04_011403 [Centaurea solstitialis]